MPHPTSIPIPLSSLLPPSAHEQSGAGPSRPFHRQSVIFGPLPSTSPLHISLQYLSLADLEPYESTSFVPSNQKATSRKGKEREPSNARRTEKESETVNEDFKEDVTPPQRVLVVTGPKGEFQDAIEDEDEDWLRHRGGDLDVLRRLKRVDIRHCPSPAHLRLLLTLLSDTPGRYTSPTAEKKDPQHILPGTHVIILWNIADLLMREEEGDENLPPDDVGTVDPERETAQEFHGKKKHFKEGVCISDYLDVLAAARAAVDHLSSLHPAQPSVQLIVLEPNISPYSSLPIMPQLKEEEENQPPRLSRANREKRIPIIDGARWLFGRDAVGVVQPQQESSNDTALPTMFTLAFDVQKDEIYPIHRKRCGRGEWAVADNVTAEDYEEGEGQTTARDSGGGWRWEWRI